MNLGERVESAPLQTVAPHILITMLEVSDE